MVSDLRASSKRVGGLYPILLDKHGNVIDGMHRLKADENWPKIKLENVETEEQLLVARLVSNVCRRNVPAEEKAEVLGGLGEIYVKKGVEPGKMAYKIAERTGMSYRWVMMYLPKKFKDIAQSERRSNPVARRATGKRRATPIELEDPPKGTVAVKRSGGTGSVNVMLDRKFYRRLEKTAEMLETTSDRLIYNAILLLIKNVGKKNTGPKAGGGASTEEALADIWKRWFTTLSAILSMCSSVILALLCFLGIISPLLKAVDPK